MYMSTEQDEQDDRIAEFLYELFISGVLTLDGLRHEGSRLDIPPALRHRLMTRCIDALYEADGLNDAA